MSLRKFCAASHHSTAHGFGSVNKLQYCKGYHVVRYSKPNCGGHHCEASNLRIAKKKLQQVLRGDLK